MEFPDLLLQKLYIFSGRKRCHLNISVCPHDIKRLCADRPRRAYNRYCFLLFPILSALLQKCQRQIVDNRCNENHTVKPIQNAAVSRNQMSVIFDIMIPLDRRCRKVTDH